MRCSRCTTRGYQSFASKHAGVGDLYKQAKISGRYLRSRIRKPFLQEGTRQESQDFHSSLLCLALSKTRRDDGLSDTTKKEKSFQIRNDAREIIKSRVLREIWGIASLRPRKLFGMKPNDMAATASL